MRAEVELYARRTSVLHDWDARWKLVSLGLLLVALVAVSTVTGAGAGAVAALLLLLAGHLPTSVLWKRLAAAQVLLLPCLVILPFTFSGGLFSVGSIQVSREGLRVAALLYLRALAILAVVMALIYSTPMVVLLRALQALRVPRVLVEITLLTYRYLFSLWWELTRLRWALATRGFGTRPGAARYRPLAGVVGVSLVRSVERTERIQHAMHCRGFQGRLRTLHRFETRPADIGKFVGVCALATWLAVGFR